MKRFKVTAGALAALLLLPQTAFAVTPGSTDIDDLRLLASTDTHGTLLNYDYFTGQPFGDPAAEKTNARGMELLAGAIKAADKNSTIVLDNGDATQGNPLETVYHNERAEGTVDPVAAVLNYLNYDAQAVGNHEFNFGLDSLKQYEGNLDFPLLGANVIDRATGKPYFTPYTMLTKTTADGHQVKVGVLGLTTPGSRVWDAKKVESLEFKDVVATAQEWVPQIREAGADVVVVSAHTGVDYDASYVWNPADLSENVGRSLAENVDGIDVIVGGHSHSTKLVQQYYTAPDGSQVLFTQPGYHGRFLSDVTIPLELDGDGKVQVTWTEDEMPSATAIMPSAANSDPGLADVIKDWHQRTIAWTSQVVGQATEDMPSATSPWEDTAILDFVAKVQEDEIKRALAETEYKDVPVLVEVSPFSRTAVFPKGDVTIADMASIYTYDNILYGIELTGKQVRDYLEWSARYYKQQEPGAEVTDWSTVTNEVYGDRSVPDYALDFLTGVNYHVNISKPVGERVENLSHPDGTPVADDDRFILGINDYRRAGGQSYPNVAEAPIIYDGQVAIRDLMVNYGLEKGVIDPADFFVLNWDLSTGSAPAPGLPEEEPEKPGADVTDEPGTDPGTVTPTDPADDKPTAGTDPSSDKDNAKVPAPKVQADQRGELKDTGSSLLVALLVALTLIGAGAGALTVRKAQR